LFPSVPPSMGFVDQFHLVTLYATEVIFWHESVVFVLLCFFILLTLVLCSLVMVLYLLDKIRIGILHQRGDRALNLTPF